MTALGKHDGRAANGGARKGAGRPQGPATKLSRIKANQVALSGEAPLDIMLDNMRFWFHKSSALSEKLSELLMNAEMIADKNARDEAFRLLKLMMAARENAQACAVDAAPYVHPRLASIAYKPENNDSEAKTLAQRIREELGQIENSVPEPVVENGVHVDGAPVMNENDPNVIEGEVIENGQ